jgi:adenylate cyclase class IV
MGWKNREREFKFEVTGKGLTLDKLAAAIQELFAYETTETIVNCKPDLYWNPPAGARATFARLRKLDGDLCQMTIKWNDKGNTKNRVEVDVEIHDYAKGKMFLEHLLGKYAKRITKKYFVYILGDEFTAVSVYKVRGDKRLFVEAEAKTIKKVKAMTKKLQSLPYKFEYVPFSLFALTNQPKKSSDHDELVDVAKASQKISRIF